MIPVHPGVLGIYSKVFSPSIRYDHSLRLFLILFLLLVWYITLIFKIFTSVVDGINHLKWMSPSQRFAARSFSAFPVIVLCLSFVVAHCVLILLFILYSYSF